MILWVIYSNKKKKFIKDDYGNVSTLENAKFFYSKKSADLEIDREVKKKTIALGDERAVQVELNVIDKEIG